MDTVGSSEIQPRSSRPWLRATIFCVLALVAGFVCLVGYGLSVQPILERCSGGAADSMTPAALVGLALVVLATYLTARTGRGARLFVAFVLAYVGLLFVLWELSPVVWGPRTCTDVGLF